jgi:hypothetical protein
MFFVTLLECLMFRLLALTKVRPVQAGTVALLLLSFCNLCLIVLAVFYRVDEELWPSLEPPAKYTSGCGYLSIALAAGSQLLYVGFAAAWLFGWIKFYPGNRIETFVIYLGLILAGGAFFTALFGAGLKRGAGLFVAFTTAGLWLLSAMASVSI